jgi:ubiquinone/menaquinone biosynthesis C-methylase UbiE
MAKTRNEKAYDLWANKYDTDPNPHITLEHDDVLALVNASKGEKILDAACGTGKYALEFSRAGAKVTGVDLSAGMLAVAREKVPNATFLKADLNKKLPCKSSQFDKVNCGQALKHIKRLEFAVSEFARVLKKNGTLTFSVTHPDMDWSDYEGRKEPEFVLSQQSDIFHYRFSHYFAAIEKAGLSIDKIVQVPVSAKIKHLLTPASFRKVKGRYQIVVFHLRKEK